MGKAVDITEKLNFEEKPALIIKGTRIEIDNSAETMLKIMGNFKNKDEDEAVIDSIPVLFPPSEKKKLDKLRLNFKDFMTVITSAMDIIRGDEEDGQGEQ
jgi:hypothetical protein